MKWTMISLALAGTVTYAIIFFAHAQNERTSAPAGVAHASTSAEIIDPPLPIELTADSSATFEAVEVSNPAQTVEPFAPAFEGDAWPAGVQAFEQGNWDVAVAALEVAVEEKPNSPYRHYLLGLSFRKVEEFEPAVSEFTRSLELAPDQVRALVALSRTQLDLGDVNEARNAIDQALEVDIDHADSWHVLGRIELTAGNLEPAAAAFRKAADRDPDHVWARNNLGYVRILQDRFDEALAPLMEAAAKGNEEAVFYNNLGIALERTGETLAATTAFGKALVLGHAPAEASYDRLETVLVARGESAADLDRLEGLDGATLVAELPQPSTEPETETDWVATEPDAIVEELAEAHEDR